MQSYDVVIVGAGMTGASLALALNQALKQSHSRLKIAVVEAKAHDDAAHPGFDARAIALSYGTVNLLKQIQIWEKLKPFASPIHNIHISETGHASSCELKAQDYHVDALGYVVALEDVGAIYHQKLNALANSEPDLDLYCPVSIEAIDRSQDEVRLSLSTGECVRANLLVAADGTFSKTCQALNIPLLEKDFGQSAIIANVATQEPVNAWAYERFTQQGPIAFLPMNAAQQVSKSEYQRTAINTKHRYSVVYCLKNTTRIEQQNITSLIESDDAVFLDKLQQDFGWRLGKLTATGKRNAYPLKLYYRERVISHRCVMIGNAAQTLHPIAGQGFNLGIRDVISLAETLIDSMHTSKQEPEKALDLGSYAVLNTYSKRRQADRDKTIALTSNLVHLFSNGYPSMILGRNLGLMALDALDRVKQPIVTRTMGLVER